MLADGLLAGSMAGELKRFLVRPVPAVIDTVTGGQCGTQPLLAPRQRRARADEAPCLLSFCFRPDGVVVSST